MPVVVHKNDMTEEKVDWDKVYYSNYKSKAFWDIHWISKANDLIASAKLLEPEVIKLWKSVREYFENKTDRPLPDFYHGSYFMLMSYAIENLLKAEIIRKNSFGLKEKFQKTKKFPEQLKEHNLVELAKKAEINFSVQEEDLLRRLTRSAIWYGRYPVPLKYQKTAGSEKFSNGKNYSVSWFGGKDVEKVNQLLTKLKHHMNLVDT